MVMLKHPEAPASSRQLYRLRQLGKGEVGELTMQEASDMIGQLEMGDIATKATSALTQTVVSSARAPFTEAHVIIMEGDQRSGKTNTATARVVDAYYNDCVRIFCEEVLHIKCEVKSYNRKSRIARIKYNGHIRRLRIPLDYKLHSPMKIFSNYHIYGIKSVFCPSFAHILAWLKAGYITNCWLVVDEAYVGMNARASMQALGKELANQYWQFGKMQLDVIIVTPMARLIDWELRTIPTEHVRCSYNEKTRKITLAIRKKGVRGEKRIDYDATQYWRNFRTNERIVQ